eukprot:GCRY01002342.1.p1 GENE.GCRY01002342.1~~GCRY01002342.1.p1  ORF type:complete len:164 (-),score=21.30 GCRY01002342.1:210-701(-)
MHCTASEIGEGDVVMVATPLIHGTIGTRWVFPPTQDQNTGVSVPGNSASFGSVPAELFNYKSPELAGFVSLTGSNDAGVCVPEYVAPFNYDSCCTNCPLFNYAYSTGDLFWADSLSHPMIHASTIGNIPDLNGNTIGDVASHGSCYNFSTNHVGVAVTEYYIR